MRENADLTRIREFMRAGGTGARAGAHLSHGGATAVLHGWRSTTLDVDLKLSPEHDELLRALRPPEAGNRKLVAGNCSVLQREERAAHELLAVSRYADAQLVRAGRQRADRQPPHVLRTVIP
jgi:hypothetical protein